MTTGPEAQQPVFVVGASRSGTALLRSVLNRHPDVFIAGETHYFDDLRTRLPGRGQSPLSLEERLVTEDYFLALSHRPYGHGGEAARARLDRELLRESATAHGGDGDAYFRAYCELSRSLEPDASECPRFWGEKTPRHVFRLPEMLARFPSATVVCIYRDPRAVVASYSDWKHQGGFDLDADEGHRQALESEHDRARSSYDPTIASLLWKGTVTAGHRAAERFGGERVRLLRYEDLVADPERVVRGLVDALGLDYRSDMLDVPMHNSSFSTFTAKAGLSTVPVDRWQSVLDPAEIATVQMWCRKELSLLRYEPVPVALSIGQRISTLVGVPASVMRATSANRHRMGDVPGYVWRRLRLVVGR